MPLSLIPQLFYDLIARIIPGMVVTLLFYLGFSGPANVIQKLSTFQGKANIFGFWSFFVVLIVSYILGFILSEVWTITFAKFTNKRTKRIITKYLKESIDEHKKLWKYFMAMKSN